MKCPKCGFVQADKNDQCKKCSHDLKAFKTKLGITTKPAFGHRSSPISHTTPSGSGPSIAAERLRGQRRRVEQDLSLEREQAEWARREQTSQIPDGRKSREVLESEALRREREQAARFETQRIALTREKERLRAERIKLEAHRELEQRRLEQERTKSEQLKLEQEKKRLELEKARAAAQREYIEQQQENERLRLEQENQRLELEQARDAAQREYDEQQLESERVKRELEELARQKERLQDAKDDEKNTTRKLVEELRAIEQETQRLEQEKLEQARQVELLAQKQDALSDRQEQFGQPTDATHKAEDFPGPGLEPPAGAAADISTDEALAPPRFAAEPATQAGSIVVPKGGFFLRAAAGIVDLGLIGLGLLFFLATGKLVFSWGMPGESGMEWSSFLLLTLPVYILTVLLAAGYFTYFHAAFGQTPGKRLFKLKVVDLEGRPPGYATAFLRFVAGLFCFLFLFMGFFWIGLDLNKQGWHDKIAQTVVIRQEG